MNEHEIARIAAAMNALRPDWPIKQLTTLLSGPMANRPRRDAAVALAWIACDANSASPYRALEQGPWWKAVVTDETTTHHHAAKTRGWNDGDPRTVCGICAMDRDECQRRSKTNGHAFVARTDCLPPHDHGAAIGVTRRGLTCGAEVIEGTACHLPTGHAGDHDMKTDPEHARRKAAAKAELDAIRHKDTNPTPAEQGAGEQQEAS
jgi:hypothetical protein